MVNRSGRPGAIARWVLAITLGATLLPGYAAADRDAELLEALRESELVYSHTGNGAFLVVFEAEQASGVATWPVVVTTVAAEEWILVYATLIDGESEQDFGERILRRALQYNSRTAGSKLALDATRGDLDVQYEIPAMVLNAQLLRAVVHDVVTTCDRRFDEFNELFTSR